ncbi:MAG: DsrE family protein [Deltaproteobacteria bacterium]|nr:DsrE family protein [Deltaproteobacteria bacterium]
MRLFSFMFAIGLILASPFSAIAESPTHDVVFEVTSGSKEEWHAALGNVENLLKALGDDSVRVEVVGHSDGLMMMTEKNLSERMKQLTKHKISFAACENTMRKKNVSKEELLPFVTTVDSGVAEVVRKQKSGWSYIKGDA